MDIDHVHFYVEDAQATRDWFIQVLGFGAIAHRITPQAHTEILQQGLVQVLLSSPRTHTSPIAAYLQQHPPGVADLAFRVKDLDQAIGRAIAAGAKLLEPIQAQAFDQGHLRWAKIAAWGDLSHTLIERRGKPPVLADVVDGATNSRPKKAIASTLPITTVDHAVLNVAAGDLEAAVAWYEAALGFQRQRVFEIQTARSGLCSQVMVHPEGTAQVPINQPTSKNSQIQEFLDENRGPGIQHIALQTADILNAIAQLRQAGLQFLRVPSTYYTQLSQRLGFHPNAADWQAIAAHEVLVDWADGDAEAMLFQTFTEPIFGQPTFFFELIQRQTYQRGSLLCQAAGFGEGNFQALFEAIEREQMKRGSLV